MISISSGFFWIITEIYGFNSLDHIDVADVDEEQEETADENASAEEQAEFDAKTTL